MNDDIHLSQIQTLWSIVRQAHGDQTSVASAQKSLLDRYGGAVRRYALAAPHKWPNWTGSAFLKCSVPVDESPWL
jgi:hypothetical protein